MPHQCQQQLECNASLFNYGLDMPGLMAAFQAFWRENSGADRRVYEYGEATPHLVLMALLQRVTNGSGHIIREMALDSGRLDLCVEFRDKRYAVEVKTSKPGPISLRRFIST